jgi:hypothetical protein
MTSKYYSQCHHHLTGPSIIPSAHQRALNDVEFSCEAVSELLGFEPTCGFLRRLFGSEPVLMKCNYGRSEPGHPGIPLHR